MGGTLLRWKPCAWLAAFCCASSLTNIKVAENDLKQVVSNVTFSLTGLLVCYLAPTTQGAAQKNLMPGPVGYVHNACVSSANRKHGNETNDSHTDTHTHTIKQSQRYYQCRDASVWL